jgi:hypothetical protein
MANKNGDHLNVKEEVNQKFQESLQWRNFNSGMKGRGAFY